MWKKLIKTAFIARLGAVALAFSLGFTVTSPASARAACGESGNCHWVPDGCGVGVGCIKKDCRDPLCPFGDGSAEDCHYCDLNP